MGGLIDISPTLHPGVAVWPGDVAFRRNVALSIASGDHLELSSIQTTVHVGAHADAPSHYGGDAPDIAMRDPALYVGPCQVIHVDIERGERIGADIGPISAPRVLLRTQTFPNPDQFNRDFAALSVELVDRLAAEGVRLVGIDTPSVDLCDDAELQAHHAILRHDLAILEGVVLNDVDEGLYTLIAPPLKLSACDASPVRALLGPPGFPDLLETR